MYCTRMYIQSCSVSQSYGTLKSQDCTQNFSTIWGFNNRNPAKFGKFPPGEFWFQTTSMLQCSFQLSKYWLKSGMNSSPWRYVIIWYLPWKQVNIYSDEGVSFKSLGNFGAMVVSLTFTHWWLECVHWMEKLCTHWNERDLYINQFGSFFLPAIPSN